MISHMCGVLCSIMLRKNIWQAKVPFILERWSMGEYRCITTSIWDLGRFARVWPKKWPISLLNQTWFSILQWIWSYQVTEGSKVSNFILDSNITSLWSWVTSRLWGHLLRNPIVGLKQWKTEMEKNINQKLEWEKKSNSDIGGTLSTQNRDWRMQCMQNYVQLLARMHYVVRY